MYGVGRLDDVAFVGDVHGLAFFWVTANTRLQKNNKLYFKFTMILRHFLFYSCYFCI